MTVGQTREQQSKLIGPAGMTVGAIGKQIELLLLDAILHLTTRTIQTVVEILRFGFQVSHQVARIAAFGGVLSLDDDAPAPIPAVGCVKHDIETSLFAPALRNY